MPRTQRLRATAILIIAFTVTLVALVPWLVINPVLAAKEFMAVVLSKAGTGSSGIGGVAGNLFIASSGLGWLTLLAAVPGSAMLWKRADGLGGIMVGFLAGPWRF